MLCEWYSVSIQACVSVYCARRGLQLLHPPPHTPSKIKVGGWPLARRHYAKMSALYVLTRPQAEKDPLPPGRRCWRPTENYFSAGQGVLGWLSFLHLKYAIRLHASGVEGAAKWKYQSTLVCAPLSPTFSWTLGLSAMLELGWPNLWPNFPQLCIWPHDTDPGCGIQREKSRWGERDCPAALGAVLTVAFLLWQTAVTRVRTKHTSSFMQSLKF